MAVIGTSDRVPAAEAVLAFTGSAAHVGLSMAVLCRCPLVGPAVGQRPVTCHPPVTTPWHQTNLQQRQGQSRWGSFHLLVCSSTVFYKTVVLSLSLSRMRRRWMMTGFRCSLNRLSWWCLATAAVALICWLLARVPPLLWMRCLKFLGREPCWATRGSPP